MKDEDRQIVVGDVGGTHARFGLARLSPDMPPKISSVRTYRTADHAGLGSAWAAFIRDSDMAPPEAAAIAVAAPMENELLRFTNSGWTIDRRSAGAELGLDRLLMLNDFGGVAHAVSALPAESFRHLFGPATGAQPGGVTTVIGPGTGLGVAMIVRRGDGSEIVETEAGHMAFAPQDAQQERIQLAIAARHGRCSIERIVSGPGLADIHGGLGGAPVPQPELWQSALDGSDPLAANALDLFISAFGAVAGDISLAHGSGELVIAGGLSNRMADRLAAPTFRSAFTAKGRYRQRMEGVSVRLLTEPEPGLFGAAIAFQRAWATWRA